MSWTCTLCGSRDWPDPASTCPACQPRHKPMTDNTNIIAAALRRLTDEKIGMREAAALFTLAEGCDTTASIAAAMEADPGITQTRIKVMRDKGFVASGWQKGGRIHRLTARGRAIVASAAAE